MRKGGHIDRSKGFYVYVVRCVYGQYYTGYTQNIEERLLLHNSGRGAKYLRGKGPVYLVYLKEYQYFKNALHAERNIKKMTRKQKEELIRIYEKHRTHD